MKTRFEYLYLGNLMIGKGIFILLNACEKLKTELQQFTCHFVGAGTSELSIEEMHHEVHKRGLQDCVQIHGPLYNHEKEVLLNQVNAFVFPTYIDCFPLVILEAMKHSLPVIATPEGAIPDMIKDGENGIIVEQKNPIALAKAMKQFADEPQQALLMGQKGLAMYNNFYTLECYLNNVRNILRKA